ncbi:MAG: hypothetical protein NTZ67_02395 [Gammaproteobacteria bacterium]|nr:hypothetical protein [Gammaproteobacteria bacterium]
MSRYNQTPPYKQLTDSETGFRFSICCNLVAYAQCDRTSQYGYYRNIEHDTDTTNGKWCGIPCVITAEWGTTTHQHTINAASARLAASMQNMGRLLNSAPDANTSEPMPDKLFYAGDPDNREISDRNPTATKLVSASTTSRAGILCCLGYSSTKQKYGLFSRISANNGGIQLPAESREPATVSPEMK